MDYIIRNLKTEDINDVARLYALFWNDKMHIAKMKEKFGQISENPDYIFLCAEKNGTVIGTIQGIVCEEIYGDCTPFLVMENFVVDKDHRGKGIGGNLFNELEKIGKEKGCSQIIFITETDRKETIAFYKKLGFDPISHKGFKRTLK
ncbi:MULTISPECIES: GNAT family N-acetyltransferase [Flavobacteriaceae]|uniref:GNAT family N-acetyltransferase n=1 Tax=Flavobacteriaceae TaxID=49546 RepID=UPI002349A38C|nr:GNAT family N-acetyltransferase [Muricauda sp. SP22]MDC6363636.1 GNAT family N-acetyltransferase [Muricauda sp. SP22]